MALPHVPLEMTTGLCIQAAVVAFIRIDPIPFRTLCRMTVLCFFVKFICSFFLGREGSFGRCGLVYQPCDLLEIRVFIQSRINVRWIFANQELSWSSRFANLSLKLFCIYDYDQNVYHTLWLALFVFASEELTLWQVFVVLFTEFQYINEIYSILLKKIKF